MLALALLASGCSSPPSLRYEEIQGRYFAPGCPNIELSRNAISVGSQSVPFHLISIKRQDILSVPKGIFVARNGECKVVVKNEPLYIPIARSSSGGVSIWVSDADELSEILYVKKP